MLTSCFRLARLTVVIGFVLATCAAFGQTAGEDATLGSWLYGQCKNAVIMQGLAVGETNRAEVMQAGRCLGYIDGQLDLYSVDHPGRFCMGDARYGTIAKVYVAYVDAHPKVLDEHRALGFVQMLAAEYSCPVQPKPRRKMR